jgi:RNA polymerase sigma-70 factor (ECF subfamily)
MANMESLYGQYQRLIYAVLRKLDVPSEDIDDVAQDTFLKVYRKLSSQAITFDTPRALSTYIHKCAYTGGIDYHRARRKTVSLDEVPESESAEVTVADELEAKERQEIVWRALRTLSDDQRRAIILKDIEGLDFNKVAEILGLSLGAAKMRVSRARKKLQQLLSPSAVTKP